MARSLFKRRKSAPTFHDLIWSSSSTVASFHNEYKPRNDSEENTLKEVQRTQRKGSLQIPNFRSPTLTDNRQCSKIQKKWNFEKLYIDCWPSKAKMFVFSNFYFLN